MRNRAVLLIAGLAAGLCGSRAPAQQDAAVPRRAPLLVVGLDGADWDVLDPLIAAGRMPHLARLRDDGASGPLATLADLALSPVIWTSVATGKGPAKHGITWFLVDGPGGRRVPVRSSDRRVKALWNVLAERGRRAGVVGWWASAPAEDVGSGVVVSDALGWHGFGRSGRGLADSVWPAGRQEEFAALIPPLERIDHAFARRFFHLTKAEYDAQSFQPSRAAAPDPDDPIQLFQEYAATTLGYAACARRLLEGDPLDVLMVYFESTDSLSHLFMKHAPPRQEWIAPEEHERFKDVVDEWYEFIDEQLGELVGALPPESTVVVLSDHGFRTGADRPRSDRTIDVHGAHLDHDPIGILVARGPPFRRGARIEGATVLDVAPTLLACLGEPAADDMDGDVLAAMFAPEFLQAHPIGRVDTFESTGRELAEGAEADAAMAQLRRLGYVSADDVGGEEQRTNLARLLLRQGDVAGARRELEAARRASPESPQPLVGLGEVAVAEGRVDEAMRHLARALTLDPDCVAALLAIASIRAGRDELRLAEAHFRQALALDARLPSPWVSLGDVLARQGRLDDAEQALAHALELDPRSLEARYNLGVVRLKRGDAKAAEADWRRALEIDPRHAPSLNNLGHLLHASGRTEEALASFRAAAAADANHFESRFNLGSILLSLGRAEEAAPWCDAALALQPEHPLAQLQGARALTASGRFDEARRRLATILRLFPLDGAACLERARLEVATGATDEAARWLREAVRRGGDAARSAIVRDPAFRELPLDEILRAKE